MSRVVLEGDWTPPGLVLLLMAIELLQEVSLGSTTQPLAHICICDGPSGC